MQRVLQFGDTELYMSAAVLGNKSLVVWWSGGLVNRFAAEFRFGPKRFPSSVLATTWALN